jgi:hypothetical protein
MTIWVLLLGCCFLTPIFLALQMARSAHASIAGYALSLIVGGLIGTGCAALMSAIHSRIVPRSEGRSVSLQNAILLSAFAAELVWVGLTGIIGWWAVRLLQSFIR